MKTRFTMPDNIANDDQLIENIDPKESAEFIKKYLETKQQELNECQMMQVRLNVRC